MFWSYCGSAGRWRLCRPAYRVPACPPYGMPCPRRWISAFPIPQSSARHGHSVRCRLPFPRRRYIRPPPPRLRKNGAAGVLGHRQGFAGQRGLVHKRFALGYVPVQRNHTAGAYHNAVAGADVIYLGQHLGAVYLLPHAVYLQAHGTGEARHGFLVCPVL